MSLTGPVPGILDASTYTALDIPDRLPGAVMVDPWTQALPGRLVFRAPRIAHYLVEGGTRIGIAPVPDADVDAVALFAQVTARGFLIHERGELALDAVTLATPNNRAIAIAGFSSAGKSTLAAVLCSRGWRLLSDDVTRITWTRGAALAWPSGSTVKLWYDACDRLHVSTADAAPVRKGMEKFHVAMPAASAPTRLHAIVRLEFSNAPILMDVSADRQASALAQCVFRPRAIEALGCDTIHRNLRAQVLRVCRVMSLGGARSASEIELADQIARMPQ
jgi:hypothetical protein